MNAEEALAESAKLHASWTDAHAEQVPVVPADIKAGKTDYNEHHSDKSAPAVLEDSLNSSLMRVIREYQAGPV